jgi:hypothetical protein
MSDQRSIETLRRLALLLAGLIHLLPLPGVVGGALLQNLYALPALDPSTELLLRHRALLFGLLAAGLLASIRLPQWRLPIGGMVVLGDLAFLALAAQQSSLAPALLRVALFDAAAVLLLACAFGLSWRAPPTSDRP